MEVIDQTTYLPETARKYPYFYVDGIDEFFPFLISWLPKGDIPIVVDYDGKDVEVGCVEFDLSHIDTMLKNYKVTLHESATVQTVVDSMVALLERSEFWWTCSGSV